MRVAIAFLSSWAAALAVYWAILSLRGSPVSRADVVSLAVWGGVIIAVLIPFVFLPVLAVRLLRNALGRQSLQLDLVERWRAYLRSVLLVRLVIWRPVRCYHAPADGLTVVVLGEVDSEGGDVNG